MLEQGRHLQAQVFDQELKVAHHIFSLMRREVTSKQFSSQISTAQQTVCLL
ncbi:MAG: hypothetical protein Ct9H90mP11_07270 [Acidimicrobiales bacterium]|nr:MAG: hypothetical protein Ct9H90mP11_07270 [Acidimicrobiales bacterium]